jgi:hypothetical protein
MFKIAVLYRRTKTHIASKALARLRHSALDNGIPTLLVVSALLATTTAAAAFDDGLILVSS